MPGWYVHMEAAKLAAKRLQAGHVPPALGFQAGEAEALGDLAHKWRNYLAIGSLGPDLFYLLPDYQIPNLNCILDMVTWVLEKWSTVDECFVGPWEETMGTVGANDSALASQLTGGLSNQLGQLLDEISAISLDVILSLLSRLGDVFGILKSGPPQGYPDSLFYWSDMFHYRKTYEFPRTLWQMAAAHEADVDATEAALTAGGAVLTPEQKAAIDSARDDAHAEKAFALGWMTHCATDVTGHPFTNAKCGGPFRLHWGRHHLVENHMDGAAYDAAHHGDTWYGELGTSALHFRVAFRTRQDSPYNGRHDSPAYDYFAGFPAYSLGESAVDDDIRKNFFDMDGGELPEHLTELIIAAMEEVYGDDPKVLVDVVGYNDGGAANPSGRPNADCLNIMWDLAFRYLRHLSRDGLHPRKPTPPTVISDHHFPSAPGATLPAEDDGRGGDPDGDSDGHGHKHHTIHFFLNLLAWIKYIGQVVLWLLSYLPGLILDVATFPAREFLYYAVIAPLYSLYMASRKLLVMEGYLLPKPGEIDAGLVTLGQSASYNRQNLVVAINSILGFAPSSAASYDEPSGRVSSTDAYGADPAFPRQTMKDPAPIINQLLSMIGTSLPLGGETNSHWTMPWKYPEEDLAGDRIGWEPHLSHPGPWVQGTDATSLLEPSETDLAAAQLLEAAIDEAATNAACGALFPNDKHLGHPVDYSLYLIQRLSSGVDVPDFNLDADRGYGYLCWDFDRHVPPLNPPTDPVEDFRVYDPTHLAVSAHGYPDRFDYQQPCTVPEQFDPEQSTADPADPADNRHLVNRYRPEVPLHIHYLGQGGGCTDLESAVLLPEADDPERDQAGMNPDGSSR